MKNILKIIFIFISFNCYCQRRDITAIYFKHYVSHIIGTEKTVSLEVNYFTNKVTMRIKRYYKKDEEKVEIPIIVFDKIAKKFLEIQSKEILLGDESNTLDGCTTEIKLYGAHGSIEFSIENIEDKKTFKKTLNAIKSLLKLANIKISGIN